MKEEWKEGRKEGGKEERRKEGWKKGMSPVLLYIIRFWQTCRVTRL